MTTTDATSLGAALAAQYALERELGRGGMATVYRARDRRHERLVALKVLHPELGATLGPERFQREIQLAARLTHPHILPVLDSGETAGRLWYAMPYVEGETLRARLEREAQLGVAEAVGIARQVAAALGYAHSQGVVHRDIKPENILLSGDQVLVADFGIAKLLDASGEKLTETGLSLGTPAYMSPEQGSGGRVDARSDVYALGCVVYEMLAGAPPFTGPTAQAILARHAVDPVPPLRTVRAQLPPAVEQAVARALAKVPADRFPSTEDFARALEADAPASVSRVRRLPGRARIAAATLVVLALSGAWMLRRSGATVVPSAASIAILPFSPTGGDTALSRLGRDLAVTISASLDGVGGIRTADRMSVSAATTGSRELSAADAAALVRRLGSRSMVRGTVVGSGDDVRLDLEMYEVEGLVPLAQGISITGTRDSLGALTDSATWSLLRQIWQRGEPPTPSLAAVTTSSVPALRAFLDGEGELARNRWDLAALAYRGAMAADSTFWLAYQRYAETQTWREQPLEPDVLDKLARHLDVLPERDRLLASAIVSAREPSLRASVTRYEEVTRRFPDYWPGWFLYGDRLVHLGGLLGFPWTRARDAMQRAVAGNPNLVPAWHHLFLISVGRDTALPARCAARLAELGFFARRPMQEQRFRELAELSRRDGRLPDSLGQLADSVARYDASAEAPRGVRLEIAPTTYLEAGFPGPQVDHNHRVLGLGVDPEIAAANLRGIALAWAARGAWDSALVWSDSAVTVDPGPLSALEAYRLAVLGAWLGTIQPVEAAKRQRAAWLALERLPSDPPPLSRPALLPWLDGVLAFAQGDRQGIERARRALRQRPAPAVAELQERARAITSFNDRSLAALDRALTGDSTRAGRVLAALEWECAGHFDCGIGNYDLALHHLAAARWLRAAGDNAEAARLLLWHQAFQGDSPWNGTLMVTPLAYLELARIEQARGANVEAREHYGQFLRRYDSPMPGQRHLVEEAQAARDRLSGAGDPPVSQ